MRTLLRGPVPSGARWANALAKELSALPAGKIIAALRERHGEGLAAVSSFGADSAVLLRLVASVDPSIRVIFLDTGKHFGETLRYRDALTRALALTNVTSVRPPPLEVVARDPAGRLRLRDPDACCALRKVRPLAAALADVSVFLTGRRRDQSVLRGDLRLFEADGPRVRVNPLAGWSQEEIAAYGFAFELPPHPLVAEGYGSIGCEPCTTPVLPHEDPRSGRWRGLTKSECGIHGFN